MPNKLRSFVAEFLLDRPKDGWNVSRDVNSMEMDGKILICSINEVKPMVVFILAINKAFETFY